MKDTSLIALDRQIIAPKCGQIKGAFYRHCNASQDDWHNITKDMSDPYFLQSGEPFSVEAGKAYMVKTGKNTWLLANFHEGGQMTGPLILSEVKAERPVETLEKSQEVNRTVGLYLLPIPLVAIVTFLHFSAPAHGVMISLSFLIMSIFLFCVGVAKLLPLVRLVYFSRNDDPTALRLLRKIEGIKPKNVPLSEFDTNFLKQSISNK